MIQAVKDLQQEAVEKLTEKFKTKDTITFQAPTGSGKTIMMAAFMNKLLKENANIVFVVSSLSKGGLGEQNYNAFVKFQSKFTHLKPYLIESETGKEENLFIPTDYNVYVLPRDLYKKDSKLKSGAFVQFLRELKGFRGDFENLTQGIREKEIYLIKDECHIATNNLDELIIKHHKTNQPNKSNEFFSKVLNVSATPKLSKGQIPDVRISEEEAVSAKLIKQVEYFEEETLQEALEKFIELKKDYVEKLGINPCLIVQISNKDKAENEIKNLKELLKSARFSHLKWMLIVDESSQKNDSNDDLKAKNLPVKKWKNYAKEHTSTIDIIIFKMVISEGWDIPRACMLYQIRDSKSKQLDEQVIGRVRRNPCLLEFENLSKEVQELVSKAYVYGIKPKNETTIAVRLKGGLQEGLFTNAVQEEFYLHTTRVERVGESKGVGEKGAFDVEEILSQESAYKNDDLRKNIFDFYKELVKNQELYKECEKYVLAGKGGEAYERWFAFNNNFELLKKKFLAAMLDYEKRIIVEPKNKVLPLESILQKSDFKKGEIDKWIWQSLDKKFYFDSEAEKEWLEFLIKLYDEEAPENPNNQKRLIKSIEINNERFYLFGKNFPFNSQLRFEYYLEGYHFSYPDFILKDYKDRIHIFEVKSTNISANQSIDTKAYENKIDALKHAYKTISKKTGYYFYIPTKKGDSWVMWCSTPNGEIKKPLTKDMLKSFLADS
ncbi:DEAD/DEAH box helicase [Helicobacter himalayensis]|uniref:DEAD/DEAH box helicase n=1 Tax=Helicobacter himalayensis TaxID=1591088 RepID=UPI003D6F02E6